MTSSANAKTTAGQVPPTGGDHTNNDNNYTPTLDRGDEISKTKSPELDEEKEDRESVISVLEAESKRNRSSSISSSSRSSRSRNRSHGRSARSRAQSFISRSLSRTRATRTRSRPQSGATQISVTRTVSEVRDGILYRRDVDAEEAAGEEQERRDLENGAPHGGETKEAPSQSFSDDADPNLVVWTGPDDPENPKNWTMKKKWAATFVVSVFTLISPVSSSMIAPALTAIGEELHISGSTEQAMTMSIFLLAYAVGPLFMGPLSELYGRMIVLQLTNVMYLGFNLGCGLARTRGQMMAFRFMSGLGGSAPLAIGGGVLGDLFTAEQRGRAMSVFSLMPLLGPAIGPIAGAFVTQQTSWRWVFYATTIADAVIQVAGLFFLRETYAPVLLSRKRDRLIKETGNKELHTVYDKEREKGTLRTLAVAFRRPFILLSTQLIVQVFALYMVYLYGLMYLLLASFPTLWVTEYHERTGIAGLNYLALGIGFFLGAQIMAPTQDRVYVYLKRRYNVSVGRPEFRVPMMIPGAFFVPVGLLIYGWCAEAHTHWIGPDIGIGLSMFGMIAGFQCSQGYLVDTYTRYAASAVGATTVMRSLAGFGFPLFAPVLFERLGYGKGNTVLAAVGIAIGWPAPFLLWKYGEYLRARSPYSVTTKE